MRIYLDAGTLAALAAEEVELAAAYGISEDELTFTPSLEPSVDFDDGPFMLSVHTHDPLVMSRETGRIERAIDVCADDSDEWVGML